MKKTKQSGFGILSIIVIVAALGVMYVMKNKDGVSYLESTYNKVKYYVVDRNVEAIDKAKEARDMMQAGQDRIKNILEEY